MFKLDFFKVAIEEHDIVTRYASVNVSMRLFKRKEAAHLYIFEYLRNFNDIEDEHLNVDGLDADSGAIKISTLFGAHDEFSFVAGCKKCTVELKKIEIDTESGCDLGFYGHNYPC